MRLIDADALIEHLKNDPLFDLVEQYGLTGVIEAEITIDAEPVRHGYWIQLEFKSIWNNKLIACSKCAELFLVQNVESEHYCRNCGAKMDGVEE